MRWRQTDSQADFEMLRLLDSQLEKFKPGGTVTITKTVSVPFENISVKEKQKPKHQIVPETKRRQTRRAQLIKKAGLDIHHGVSFKRVQRELARRGIPRIRKEQPTWFARQKRRSQPKLTGVEKLRAMIRAKRRYTLAG